MVLSSNKHQRDVFMKTTNRFSPGHICGADVIYPNPDFVSGECQSLFYFFFSFFFCKPWMLEEGPCNRRDIVCRGSPLWTVFSLPLWFVISGPGDRLFLDPFCWDKKQLSLLYFSLRHFMELTCVLLAGLFLYPESRTALDWLSVCPICL